MRRWILERGRISCQRQSYTELSGCWAQRYIACESEGDRLRLGHFENVRQRTWDYIPNRDCMWDSSKKKQKSCCALLWGALFFLNHFIVVMRHTCQVTNQSSHGELSFHHNPHLPSREACAFRLFALFGEEAQDWKMQLTLHTVIVVSYAR